MFNKPVCIPSGLLLLLTIATDYMRRLPTKTNSACLPACLSRIVSSYLLLRISHCGMDLYTYLSPTLPFLSRLSH